ncbi:MAG: hypothetical protein LC725_05140, partial [Lentisphaerae bacterium]|nr:hypothetical protein [Lentisphaerota bacterium]
AWRPRLNGEVLCIVADASTVFAGGTFSCREWHECRNLAAMDGVTGNIIEEWAPDPDGTINCLAVSPDGAIVYAGGGFSHVAEEEINYIAAISAETGLPTAWQPNANSDVTALALSPDGAIVYAGGAFTRMNIIAEDRNYLAAIAADTGIPTDWDPGADSSLHAIAVSPDGATVYVGGGFSVINDRQRKGIAAIAADTGVPTGWNPGTDRGLYAISLSDDGQRLYAGGYFSSMKHTMYGFAMFSPQHTLTYTAGANGAISGTATQTVYHGADGTAVTATPNTGYHFTQWSDTSTANPRRDLNVTGDKDVMASFALSLTAPDKPAGVTASAGEHVGEVRLNWTASARAAGYEIWRDVSASGDDMTLLGASVGTAFTDTAIAVNVNYYYWIRATNAAGDSAYSSPAHGFPGELGPMIMANGRVGDNITLGRGENLTLSVRLNMGEGVHRLPAVDVDWWLAAYLHDGGAWYYMDNAMNWTLFDGNLLHCHPVHRGPLFNLPATQVGPVLSPAPGLYNVWFGVDYPSDGILDISNPDYYRASRVTITVRD